jgi:hypothetical protein
MSNWPPPRVLIAELQKRGMHDIVEYMLRHGFLDNCKPSKDILNMVKKIWTDPVGVKLFQ